ncbi:MAG: recombination mediator RecR [Chthoniobacterales bacterium]|nr:recombination mediator RecR [Chthoniobacterales bacterium]
MEILLSELKRIPGLGPKGASRIALWLLSDPSRRSIPLSRALANAAEKITLCLECGFWAEATLCKICSDSTRNGSVLCVVEQPMDVLSIEKTGIFRGLYHVLGGRLSPLNQVGPEHLRISQLLKRVEQLKPQEVILALGADVESLATMSYLSSILKEKMIKVSKIAFGIPAGGGIEHADVLTLQNAFKGRSLL